MSQESNTADGFIYFQISLTFALHPPPTHFRLVNPSMETLEEGLTRELSEELGVAIPISVEDHVESCYAHTPFPSSSPQLITHFYVKKMEEEQIREVERVAASTAADHGLEVVCVCVPVPVRVHVR